MVTASPKQTKLGSLTSTQQDSAATPLARARSRSFESSFGEYITTYIIFSFWEIQSLIRFRLIGLKDFAITTELLCKRCR